MSKTARRVLVTGGSGFLGSHVADALTAAGHEVTVLDRAESHHLRSDQRFISADLLDAEAVGAAVEHADVVYHLAALADINDARARPLETARANFLGTVHVLEAARRTGVERLLFASTVYVYSRAGGFYRCSKQACESYIEEYRRQFGLRYTILRFGSLYGPRADDGNGVYRLLKQAAAEGRIRHTGTPDDVREYLHVEDAARLAVEALASDFEDQHLILTGPQAMRLRDLFTMFSEILGREIGVEYLENADGSHDHYRVTPYAFRPQLGRKLTSRSTVDMGQGILQMLAELEDTGDERA